MSQTERHPGKTENFGTRNIRLITFLVVLGLEQDGLPFHPGNRAIVKRH